jgi:2-iminobutanoate/2-iminopropanoate deaminase
MGTYSPGIRVGDLLFLSGQAPFDDNGTLVRGSVAAQVSQALSNLDRVARAGGTRLQHAARVGVYLSDLSHFEEMDVAYREFFTEDPPARTTIQSEFVGFDVEIDAIVVVET